MKIISCDNCATILDHDKLPFPKDIWLFDGESESIDPTKAYYNQNTQEWAAFCLCPVCKEKVFEK